MSGPNCGVRWCYRKAEKSVTYQGKQLKVCALCYEIIMRKLGDRLARTDNGTRRKH